MFFKKKKAVSDTTLESRTARRITQLKKGKLDESSLLKLNEIIRAYLRLKFKFAESLTVEEILDKINEKKIKKSAKLEVANLLFQIYQKEYFPHDVIDSKEIEYLINLSLATFKKINAIQEGKSSAAKLEVRVPDIKPTANKSSGDKSSALLLIEKDIALLDKDVSVDWRDEKFRQTYERIRSDYDKLSDTEKKVLYPKIIALFKLKSDD